MSHGSHNPVTKYNTSVTPQNLTDEGLLLKARRDAENRPLMGGIPLIAKLGQGGMGAVYYGIHPRLNLEVAVKVLPFHLADANPDMIRRFFGEAQIAARVQSEHIVRVLDVNEEAGVYYLVMEYVKGMSAAGVLKALQRGEFVSDVSSVVTSPSSGSLRALSTPAAMAIMVGAARGLSAAHHNGIIHRDIKPDNIMIPRGLRTDPLVEPPLDLGRAKLADLGLAKIDDGSSMGTMSQMAMGTPGFMAPEQIRDAKRASKQSDVFSLGATLYALLAGRMPFAGSGVGDILIKTVSNPHDPLVTLRPDVPLPIQDLIDHCLNKDPDDRFPDGAALLEALLLVQGGGSIPSISTRGPAGGGPTASSRGYAGALTPPTMALPDVHLGRRPSEAYESAGPSASPALPMVSLPPPSRLIPTQPQPAASGRTGLIVTLVIVLLLLIGVGGAAGYWFGVVVPAREEYLRMVHDGHERFQAAKQEYAAGKLSDEDYLTRVQGALAFIYDALNHDNHGIEAQREQDEMNAERDRVSYKIESVKNQAETAYHDLFNRAMLKEASATSEADEAAGIALWREAADLYRQAHDVKAAEAGPTAGLVRAQSKIDAYLQRTNQAVAQKLAAAQAIERAAQEEPDLAKQRQLWQDAAAAYEKIRAVAPEHPALAPGLVRIKAGLDAIKAQEEGEINMLVLAAQVAADRGSVAKDPTRALEDWTAAATGFEKALALRPKDPAIKTKFDNATKKRGQLETFFALVKTGEDQGRAFCQAHSVADQKTAAAACVKALSDALAVVPDDLTRNKLDVAQTFPAQAAQCERADSQAANEDPWAAIAGFTKITTANQNLAYAWYRLGQLKFDQTTGEEKLTNEERDDIGAKFSNATVIDPLYAEAWYAWGQLLERSEPQTAPDNPDKPAEPAEDEGDLALQQATVKYARAVAADPELLPALRAWARGLTSLYQYGLACQTLGRVIARDPKNVDALIESGQALDNMYCYDTAVDFYAKAAALAPDRADAWADWAEALARTYQTADALEKMTKAAALAPDSIPYKQRVADLTAFADQWKKEIDEQRRLLALADAKVITLDETCNLLQGLLEHHRYKEADLRARAAVSAFPESAKLWHLWSTLLSTESDYEAALQKENQAVKLAPDTADYTDTVTWLQESADEAKATRAKLSDYAKALEADPHDVEALSSWSSALYGAKRYDEALVKVKRGLELAPQQDDLLQLQYQIADELRAAKRTEN